MFFYIGEFSRPIDLSNVIHIKDPVETETLQCGNIIERWDRIFEWDTHCVKASELEEWRAIGDPLCDAALRSMFKNASSSAGIDLLERLEEDAASDPGGASQALLEHASSPPPDDIAASPQEIIEAQDFFLQNSLAFMQALMHFSLAGGFASPRITRVLQAVSYLVPPYKSGTLSVQLSGITPEMNDRTYSRLLETFQFTLDIMGCTRPANIPLDKPGSCIYPGGNGWKSTLRVRLLHGIARRRILEQLNSSNSTYSIEEDGIPINQEDMAATLGSFSVAPIWCIPRLYSLATPIPTPTQVSAFMALWRQVGFYLGIDPSILRKYFGTYQAAEKFLASSVIHLLTSPSNPPGTPRPLFPTLPILLASSDRPPFPRSFELSCALTRHLLGPSLSSHLGVPPTPLRVQLSLLLSLLVAEIPVFFACLYPRRNWSIKRGELTRDALARVVRFQMGMRRTTFRARDEGGEIGLDVLAAETVKSDPDGAKKMVKEYRLLILEMVGVLVGVAGIFVGSLLGCWARYVGWI